MALSARDYLQQLQALLPLGPAWPREANAAPTQLLGGLAEELARTDARINRLLTEADPRASNELLADWERVAGLPDACTQQLSHPSLRQRRAALTGRLTGLGGQSAAYYISLAKTLGYNISITEFRSHSVADDVEYPFYAVVWNFAWQVNTLLGGNLNINAAQRQSVDDPVNYPIYGLERNPLYFAGPTSEAFTVESSVEATLENWPSYTAGPSASLPLFTVNSSVKEPLETWPSTRANYTPVRVFTVKSTVKEPLASWQNALFKCTFDRIAPAHTFVLYSYSES